MQPVVQFDNVTKSFGSHVAVDNLNLSVEAGKFVTLLGPSGCGKSTTLRMLGGFDMPTSGRILLNGRDVTRVPPNKRNVNIVFQDYALFPHLTVARNIAFGLELKGLGNAAIHQRVSELLELVQLQDFARRLPSELSGGQRQRVALMRALAPDPDVLLLDEPLSALDAKLRQQMQIELKAIQEQTGKTFMFVTHDQEEALDLADRVVILDHGRIVQEGSPQEVCRNPASAFVTRFLGDTNRLEAQVRGGVARIAGGSIAASGVPDGHAEIYARPADLEWAGEGVGLSARILRVLDRPDSRRLVARLDDGETVELDVTPETVVSVGDQGAVKLRRANVFSLA